MNGHLKHLWHHINKRRKKQLAIIMILMLLASIAEVVSIGAVVPFLGVLSNPQTVFEHEIAQQYMPYLDITAPDQLLLPLTITFAVAALIAGIMRIVLLWGQTRMAHAVGADLSYEIYQRTLYQSYITHAARNSSEVIAGISTKADQVVYQAIIPVMHILSSLLMLSMLLVTLILINPEMAIMAMVGFATIYLLFMYLTKSSLLLNSQRISNNTNALIKVLQEGLGGIRDVLIDGTQSIYCKTFRQADLPRRRALADNQIIGLSPRYGVESLGMVLIAGLAYYLSNSQGSLVGALPLLGALAIGAQRMLPMLQQAYGAWSQIRGAEAVVKDALVLLEQPMPSHAEHDEIEKISFYKSIQLQQLGFQYQDDAPKVIDSLDLVIKAGTNIGFIGTTGSGKSTLLDIVMALLHPTKGKMLVDGVEITDENHRSWQSHIAHIPQAIFLSDATIAKNIAFGIPIDKIDLDLVKKVAQQAQIHETIINWEHQYETMVGERGVRLSGGQRQRIGIARALYKQANMLILDEATSALDNATEKAVMDAIHKEHSDITILMVAHRLSTLQACDKIVELENGTIKRQGTPDEMIDLSH